MEPAPILVLTGPSGAGKNTAAAALARGRPAYAVVDFDAVRAMFVQPHHTPWDGNAGRQQQDLSVEMVCALALGFARAGHETVVLDVVTDASAAAYRRLLAPFGVRIAQLLPDRSTVVARAHARAVREGRSRLTPDELESVYRQQAAFDRADVRLDTARLSPEAVAAALAPLLCRPNDGLLRTGVPIV